MFITLEYRLLEKSGMLKYNFPRNKVKIERNDFLHGPLDRGHILPKCPPPVILTATMPPPSPSQNQHP